MAVVLSRLAYDGPLPGHIFLISIISLVRSFFSLMIRIAFEAIATLPSSVGYEQIRAPNGDYHVWLEPRFVDRLRARPGKSYSDVILRLAEVSAPPRQDQDA